jgi:hypothetical protein
LFYQVLVEYFNYLTDVLSSCKGAGASKQGF